MNADHKCVQPRVRKRSGVLAGRARPDNNGTGRVAAFADGTDEHERSGSIDPVAHHTPDPYHLVSLVLQRPLRARFHHLSIAGLFFSFSIYRQVFFGVFLHPKTRKDKIRDDRLVFFFLRRKQ